MTSCLRPRLLSSWSGLLPLAEKYQRWVFSSLFIHFALSDSLSVLFHQLSWHKFSCYL